MKSVRLRLCCGFVSIALFATAQAFAGELRCPPEIAVEQKANDPPVGWTVGYNGFRNGLASVTIYDGPPEQGASLVYDDEKTAPDTITQTWTLVPGARGYWMTCGYSNTAAQVSRKIPANATRCEVVLERNVSFADGRHPVRRAACVSSK
jgi:hypothetical protein